MVCILPEELISRGVTMRRHFESSKRNIKVGEVRNFNKHKNRRLWKFWSLSIITIMLVIVATTVPAFAQFTPPNANGATGITCIGFFCNVAQKVNQNALFTPIGSAINGLVTIVNVGFGLYYMGQGYGLARKINRNQEEWKQDAFSMGTSLGFIVLTFVISLAFVTT